VPADAEASEAVDSTLAEPVPAAAALGSAPHDSLDVGSESEVPDYAAAAMRFAVLHIADLCRSPPQRAAVPQICLHMQCNLNPSRKKHGSIQRNRSLLTANNSMHRVSQQVFKLRGHDRVEH